MGSALLASLLVLQASVTGVVRRADGTPWAGASVVLCARPVPTLAAIAEVDVVRAQSDERGRFKVSVGSHRVWSAWATGDERDGSYATTRVAEDVIAGVPVRLLEDDVRLVRRRVRLLGAEGWKAKQPLRATVTSIYPRNVWAEPLALDAEHTARLPALPGRECWIDVLGQDDYPIQSFGVRIERTDVAAEAVLELGAPKAMELTVKEGDEKDGKPVAGCTLWLDPGRTRAGWKPLGAMTDAEGKATVLVAEGGEPYDVMASRDGYSAGYAGGEAVIGVQPGFTVRGRLLRHDGTAMVGVPLLLYAATPNLGSGSYQNVLGPLVFTTDDGGRFAIPGRTARYASRVCAVPAAAELAANGLPENVCRQLVVWVGGPTADLDLGDLRIDRLPRVEVEAEGTDNPDRLEMVAMEGGTRAETGVGGIGTWFGVRTLADRRGRASFVLPPGSLWTVVSGRGACSGLAEVEVRAGAQTMKLRLGAQNLIEGRLVGEQGQPAAGAWAAWSRLVPTSTGNQPLVRLGWMRGFGQAWRLLHGDRWIASGDPNDRWRRLLSGFAPEDGWVEVKADGTFVCAVPAAVQISLVGVARTADGSVAVSKDVSSTPGNSVELTIDTGK